jgi:hypothetical protein
MNIQGTDFTILGDSHTAWESKDMAAAGSGTINPMGRLIGGYLMDHGASHVRILGWRGLSGYHYIKYDGGAAELASQLTREDNAGKSKVLIVILGTNDIGLAAGPVEAAYAQIKQVADAAGAETWMVGPPMFPATQMIGDLNGNAGAAQVVDIEKKIFAPRFIDSRPITKDIPAQDRAGIHFKLSGYTIWAAGILSAILSGGQSLPEAGMSTGKKVALVAAGVVATAAIGFAIFEISRGPTPSPARRRA